MDIPLLGMGTWGMGGKFEKDRSNFEESVTALKSGLALGLKLIDTAELYGQGLTEEIVAEAIKDSPRKDIFIISKVSRDHLRYDDMLKAAERSLGRLGTDYLDLYLIHKYMETVPLEETMRAMEKLRDEGKVKYIGVSNFTVAQMKEASRHLKNTRLSANQIEYSIGNQEAGEAIIPFCKEHGIAVIAHRPLGKGELVKENNGTLGALALKYGRTRAQIALNWIISQGITAIPKTTSIEHLKENLEAQNFIMEKKDVAALDKKRP